MYPITRLPDYQMKACIVAVGSEMLTPFRVDTNSLFITERLNAIGYDVRLKAVVGDDVGELARLLATRSTWADLIVITGGLGPTEDDITRDAVARVLGVPLDVDEQIVDHIRERFARRGMTMPEINRRQAMVPRGATVLAESERHGARPVAGERQRGDGAAARAAARDEADAGVGDRRAPRGEGGRRRAVPARAQDHGPRGIRRGRAGAAGLRRWTAQAVPISTTILAVLGQIELHLTARR